MEPSSPTCPDVSNSSLESDTRSDLWIPDRDRLIRLGAPPQSRSSYALSGSETR